MANATERDESVRELETMTKKVQDTINHKKSKFDGKEVVALALGWIRVCVRMRGQEIFKIVKLLLTKKGVPGKVGANFTRAQELYANLNIYKKRISDGNETETEFSQAGEATFNFVYEYRNQFKPNSHEGKTFELLLTVALNNEEKS
jgi:hypothetical protein